MASTVDAAEELADQQFERQQQQQGRGGGGKKGGKQTKSAGGAAPGSGSAADGGKKREKQISMALSRLLRHQALNAGIVLDKEGYAPLEKVVSSFFLFFLCFFLAPFSPGWT